MSFLGLWLGENQAGVDRTIVQCASAARSHATCLASGNASRQFVSARRLAPHRTIPRFAGDPFVQVVCGVRGGRAKPRAVGVCAGSAACGLARDSRTMSAMVNPIVIAYHLIWTVYGWWLPNDPRGSTSTTVRKAHIGPLGDIHFGRRTIQPAGTDIRAFYEQAAQVLKHPLLEVRCRCVDIVAEAFEQVMQDERYTCYACAIMPDHVHVLIRKHKHTAEEMIDRLQEASRLALLESELFAPPGAGSAHPVWTRGGWKVFLDHPDEVQRTIPYIENNPIKIDLPRQRWPFVVAYDRWPLHVGHSPNSPYARALRAAGRQTR